MFSPVWQYLIVSSTTVLHKTLAYFFAANATLKMLGNFTVISVSCLALYGTVVTEFMLKISL